MKPLLLLCLILGPQSLLGQPAAQHVKPNSKIFIEPMNGFETYLTAAIIKKQVPAIVVSDRAQADYILAGISEDEKAGWAKTIFVSGRSHATASVSLKEAKTGNLVWAYNVDKFASVRANQSTAEACAKHLKNEAFEKGGKW